MINKPKEDPMSAKPDIELKGGIGEPRTVIPLPKKTVQQVLNEFTAKHGSNWPQWADAPLMLAGEGIDISEVTPERLKAAEEWSQEKKVQETTAKRPRLVPLYALPLGTKFEFPFPSTKGGELLALDSDAKIKTKDGNVEWISTHSLVVPLLLRNGTHTITEPTPEENSTQEKETDMAANTHEIALDDARLVGTALGNGNAAGWSTKRAALKLNDLPKLMEGVDEVGDKKAAAVLKELSVAIKEGKTIVVTEGKHEGNGKPGKKGTKKDKKTSPAKPAAEKDKYGSRVGTDCAKVNSVLSSQKARTELEIREKAGVKNSVEYHLDKLVRLGHLKWTEKDGYILK